MTIKQQLQEFIRQLTELKHRKETLNDYVSVSKSRPAPTGLTATS